MQYQRRHQHALGNMCAQHEPPASDHVRYICVTSHTNIIQHFDLDFWLKGHVWNPKAFLSSTHLDHCLSDHIRSPTFFNRLHTNDNQCDLKTSLTSTHITVTPAVKVITCSTAERWTTWAIPPPELPMNGAGTNDTKQRSSPFTSYFRSVPFRFIPFKTRTSYNV